MTEPLKKLLLVGDSISVHYGPYLETYLKGCFTFYTKEGREEALADLNRPVGGNGGDSGMVLDYLRQRRERDGLPIDIFVFNCGLHDIKRKLPEEPYQVPIEQYRRNLNEILDMMDSMDIRTAFITTTPVEDERHNSYDMGVNRYDRDVHAYNEAALAIVNARGVSVIDLGGFTRNLEGEKYMDHVHYMDEVRKIQAAFLAGAIRSLF